MHADVADDADQAEVWSESQFHADLHGLHLDHIPDKTVILDKLLSLSKKYNYRLEARDSITRYLRQHPAIPADVLLQYAVIELRHRRSFQSKVRYRRSRVAKGASIRSYRPGIYMKGQVERWVEHEEKRLQFEDLFREHGLSYEMSPTDLVAKAEPLRKFMGSKAFTIALTGHMQTHNVAKQKREAIHVARIALGNRRNKANWVGQTLKPRQAVNALLSLQTPRMAATNKEKKGGVGTMQWGARKTRAARKKMSY